MIYTCLHCGSAFKRTGAIKPKFCSRSCKSGASKSRTATCRICGVDFITYGDRPGKYCSRKCKGIGSRLPMKNCEVCGKEFKPRMGRSQQPCCSRECGAKFRRTGSECECKQCGTGFYVPKCRENVTTFCSIMCHNAWQGRNKTSHACKTCGAEFRWSPSRTASGNYNVTYCSPKCRDRDPDWYDQLMSMNVMQQRMKKRTRIEVIGYEILDSLNVEYIPQNLLVKKFCVDAFIPLTGVVVQFDGDYWHGHPIRFPKLDARQQRRAKLDKSQDAYLNKCGYHILRFWESDILSNPESVKQRIQAFLATLE